jgi:hypothetical protein
MNPPITLQDDIVVYIPCSISLSLITSNKTKLGRPENVVSENISFSNLCSETTTILDLTLTLNETAIRVIRL